MQANVRYSVKTWERKPWETLTTPELTATRLSRVVMIHLYEGDIEGEGVIQYLFASDDQNKGGFTALEKITGCIDGRSGSFVLQRSGSFEHGVTRMNFVILPELGTGELSTLTGHASFEVEGHPEQFSFTLDYAL